MCLGRRANGRFFQGDVTAAYLQSELHEKIYVSPAPGYEKKGVAWLLLKPLYGLKQAGKEWRDTFHKSLLSCGLRNCEADPGTYYSYGNNKELNNMMAIHVDDFYGWSASDKERDALLSRLSSLHKLSYTYNPAWLLHMELKYGEDESISVSQENYVDKCLKHFGLSDVPPKRVPMEKGCFIEANDGDESEIATPEEKQRYMAMIGSLNYLATHTRPDIAYSTHQLSKQMHNPSKEHIATAENVFAYLHGTKHSALRYNGEHQGKVALVGYTDASFPPSFDARATIGMIWFLTIGSCWNVISWHSRKLRHICDSTEEAELSAASEGVKEGIALKSMLVELGSAQPSLPIVLYLDNKAAVCVAQDGGYYPRLKHVNRKHKYVMEAVREHGVQVLWCRGEQMLADGLTKALGRPQLDAWRNLLYGRGMTTAIRAPAAGESTTAQRS
jgi:hypothetical protein